MYIPDLPTYLAFYLETARGSFIDPPTTTPTPTHFKSVYVLDIGYKSTNNSEYEYSDHITHSVPLSKQIVQEENILLFLFHHIHQTF